jgi:hypothetical protein
MTNTNEDTHVLNTSQQQATQLYIKSEQIKYSDTKSKDKDQRDAVDGKVGYDIQTRLLTYMILDKEIFNFVTNNQLDFDNITAFEEEHIEDFTFYVNDDKYPVQLKYDNELHNTLGKVTKDNKKTGLYKVIFDLSKVFNDKIKQVYYFVIPKKDKKPFIGLKEELYDFNIFNYISQYSGDFYPKIIHDFDPKMQLLIDSLPKKEQILFYNLINKIYNLKLFNNITFDLTTILYKLNKEEDKKCIKWIITTKNNKDHKKLFKDFLYIKYKNHFENLVKFFQYNHKKLDEIEKMIKNNLIQKYKDKNYNDIKIDIIISYTVLSISNFLYNYVENGKIKKIEMNIIKNKIKNVEKVIDDNNGNVESMVIEDSLKMLFKNIQEYNNLDKLGEKDKLNESCKKLFSELFKVVDNYGYIYSNLLNKNEKWYIIVGYIMNSYYNMIDINDSKQILNDNIYEFNNILLKTVKNMSDYPNKNFHKSINAQCASLYSGVKNLEIIKHFNKDVQIQIENINDKTTVADILK